MSLPTKLQKRNFLAPLGLMIICLMICELIVRMQMVPDYLFPSPSQVIQTYQELSSDYAQAFQSTAVSVLYGLLGSFLVGNLLAFIFSLSPVVRSAFLPFSVLFQTVPIVALAPLMVIWFGFGEPTVRASAFIVSLFPILTNSTLGLSQFNENLDDLFKLYKANKFQKLLKLQIPSAVPYILSGLKIAAGLAVIGAIVGEFVSGGGLGSLIDSARTQQRVDIVFGAVVLSSLLGLVLITSISFLEIFFKKKRLIQ